MRTARSSRVLDPVLECASTAERAARLSLRLRATLHHAHASAPRARRALDAAGIDLAAFRGLEDLQRIPITRKEMLTALQAEEPPFAGLAAVEAGALARAFMSPGPIFDPQGAVEDFWRFAPALAAAGFRAGDVVLNSASYHLTPLGFMLDAGARRLGCAVVPGGTAPTEQQVRAAAHLRAACYLGLPSFLRTLLARGREAGTPLALEVAFVIAEMLPESLREELERDFGVRVLQGYGTADHGLLAHECSERGGWHLASDAIVELLDPATGRPVAPGEPGEVVATVLDEAYPLLRLATGDVSALAPEGACPCGRTTPKLAGLLGRIGDGVKVKGLFVRAGQLEEALRAAAEVRRWQAIVTREAHHDRLRVVVEVDDPAREGLAARLEAALRERLTVRAEVELAREGTIPEGARKIDDRRVWT
jgi:phenylacetate-CoA ligase